MDDFSIEDSKIELINRRSASALQYFSMMFSDLLPFHLNYYHYSPFQNYMNNPWHMHSHVEMQFVFRGKAQWETRDTEMVITPGTLMVLPQEVLHHRVGIPDKAQLMGFQFHVPEASLPSVQRTSADNSYVFDLPEEIRQKIISVPPIVLSEHTMREKQAAIILGNIILQIFQLYFPFVLEDEENLKQLRKGTQDFRDQVYHSALKYVNDNLSKAISVDDVAKTCGVSSRHLNRIFSQYEGITLGKYVTKRRIDRSFGLLARTNLSQTEIAEKLGFSDSAHFIRTFQRSTGTTPGKYRKQVPSE